MRLNTYIRLDVNKEMTVAKETYAIFDEELNHVEVHHGRKLKKTMVDTMVSGKLYRIHTKIHLKDNLFLIEAGQSVFHKNKYLMIFGKLGTDRHCRMMFIDETHTPRRIHTFTENNLTFDNTHRSFLQKLNALRIQDIIAEIDKVDMKQLALLREPHVKRNTDERVRGEYEKFFLGLKGLDINYPGSTETMVHETVNFADIIKWKSTDVPCKAELVHTFIQWMFPTTQRSQSQQQIDPITENEAKFIASDIITLGQFMVGYEWFLSFLGIRMQKESGILMTSDDWPQRKVRLDVLKNHNFVRLTRVLYALRGLGLCRYMTHLYAFLVIHYEHFGDECKGYWMDSFIEDKDPDHNHVLFYQFLEFMHSMQVGDFSPHEIYPSSDLYQRWLTALETIRAQTPVTRALSEASPPGIPKFKVGDLCWYTPQDSGMTMVKVMSVDAQMEPCNYTVLNMNTDITIEIPFVEELVAIKAITPLQMSKQRTFTPNAYMASQGYLDVAWDPETINQRLSRIDRILDGFYRHFRTDITWGEVYRRVIADNGWMDDQILRFFGHWCCFTYGGLTSDSNAADVAAHLAKARADMTETYIVLQSNEFLSADMTFNNLDCLWNAVPAIRDISPGHVDNILVTMHINHNHWILGHISLKNSVIHVYDSFNNPPPVALTSLNQLKRLFYRRKLEDDIITWNAPDGIDDVTIRTWHNHASQDWPVNQERVPQQRDTNACGAYACMIMAYIMSGNHAQISSDMLFENIPAFRSLMGRIICETNCTPQPRL